jgi:hypothetical protein
MSGTFIGVRRRGIKRALPWNLTARDIKGVSPPQAEDIPPKNKPRLEEFLPVTTDEAARKTASPDLSVGLPPPAADNDDDANTDPVTDTQSLRMQMTSNSGNKYQNNPLQQHLLPNVRGGMMQGGMPGVAYPFMPGMMPQGNITSQQQQAMWQQQMQHMMLTQMQQMHMMQMQMQQQQRGQQQPPTPQQPPMQQGGATGRWTPKEDAKLTNAVSNTCKTKHGEKLKIDWVAVAALVPGRTKNECKKSMIPWILASP